MIKTVLFALLAATAGQAAVLYNNTTGDQQFSPVYSTGYTEIGDQVQLASQSLLTSLAAQFYNLGSDATFDATVTFYETGAPVGSLIGSPFTVIGISIGASASQTVTFADLGGLLVPADLIVVFSVQNVSSGGDIGVNLFDPPTVGTSDNTFFFANDGNGLAQASTLLDIDNIYLLIEGTPAGTPIPEPATAAVTFALLAVLALCKRHV
jgi:hypothetical protein